MKFNSAPWNVIAFCQNNEMAKREKRGCGGELRIGPFMLSAFCARRHTKHLMKTDKFSQPQERRVDEFFSLRLRESVFARLR